MTYRGHVKNGVVVFNGPEKPPDGAPVEVAVLESDAAVSSETGLLRDLLLDFSGTVEGLPADMAKNHDHYAHGRPKR
jgi:hypothetical protein